MSKFKSQSSMRNSKAKFQLISAITVFGTIGIFVHYIPLPSGIIAFSRGIIGAIFLLITIIFRKEKISVTNIKHNFFFLLVSGAFIGMNWILLFESYKFTTVAVATLCYYLAPVFLMILSPIIFKEKIKTKNVVCILLSLLGMVLVSDIFNTSPEGKKSFAGVLLGLGAALFYTGVIIINKQLKSISNYERTVVQLISASVVMLPYLLITVNIKNCSFSLEIVLLLLTVGILHTGISYAMYFGSICKLKAQTVAIFSYIDPIVAIFLSGTVLKERISVSTVSGALLILGSTLISELTQSENT